MEIYIVTSGAYSDYRIDAVFTDKKQAELYCATKRFVDMEIEEWEADAEKIITDKEPLKYWTMYFSVFENTCHSLIDRGLVLGDIKEIVRYGTSYGGYEARLTTPVDYEEEKVRKIMHDYIAQWKYNYFIERANGCLV